MKAEISRQPRRQVGIWLRVSTEMQAESDSPEHHKARAMSYAVARDWQVREIYDLSGVSGKSVREHPETKRMLADVKRGHITGLIFSKLARLARNTRELLDFADYFQEHDADLVSLGETIDTSSPAGRLFFTLIAAMATWERDEIAERVKASVIVRAKMGKPLGQLPFGYRYQAGRIEPDPSEAPVRKLVYELFAENKRKKTTARLLNERGLRTRSGHKFTDTTVARLITDPTAKGEHRGNYTKNVGDGKAWALKPEHDWILTKVEPIVSPELWNRCNAFFEARRTTGERPARQAMHAFTGFVFCECSGKMRVPTGSPKYICKACGNRIPKTDLDELFRDELKAYMTAPEKVAEYRSKAESAIEAKREMVAQLKKELVEVRLEGKKAFSLHCDDKLTADQFKEWFAPLDERKKQIEKEVPALEGEIAALSVKHLSTEVVMAEADSFYDAWPTLEAAQKRRLVETLVNRIAIGKEEVTISLAYLPSLEAENWQRMSTGSWRRPA
jgi:site-specific DNA recombinase